MLRKERIIKNNENRIISSKSTSCDVTNLGRFSSDFRKFQEQQQEQQQQEQEQQSCFQDCCMQSKRLKSLVPFWFVFR